MKYLTVQQLANAPLGIDLSTVSAVEQAIYIEAAEGLVDAYCGVEHQPRAWYQQSHWEPVTRRIYFRTSPVPVFTIDRVRIQVSSQVGTGNPFVANIQPNDVVVDNNAGWGEVVSLMAILYSLTPAVVNLGLNTILALTDYHTSWLLDQFGETLLPDPTNKSFTASRAFWASSVATLPGIVPLSPHPCPPVVYVNGAVQSSGYAIDYTNGVVTFTAAQPAGAVVTCDYTYTIPDPVREATRVTTTMLLGERNANQAGAAGFDRIDLPDQISVSRAQATQLPKVARLLLSRYRHLSVS